MANLKVKRRKEQHSDVEKTIFDHQRAGGELEVVGGIEGQCGRKREVEWQRLSGESKQNLLVKSGESKASGGQWQR